MDQNEKNSKVTSITTPPYGQATVVFWGGLQKNVVTGTIDEVIEALRQEKALQGMGDGAIIDHYANS